MPNLKILLLLASLALAGCSTSSDRTASSGGVNARQMIVPKGRVGRHKEFRMRPSYITIHSTGNRGATALQHVLAVVTHGAAHVHQHDR